ncbi:hypothetical protein H9P43_004859 [Blastocladiella emersonii ATCC 22665]|nr:hypothetical protein H9P43_004859 [Blastocladiella emersonii ATCC 22665]
MPQLRSMAVTSQGTPIHMFFRELAELDVLPSTETEIVLAVLACSPSFAEGGTSLMLFFSPFLNSAAKADPKFEARMIDFQRHPEVQHEEQQPASRPVDWSFLPDSVLNESDKFRIYLEQQPDICSLVADFQARGGRRTACAQFVVALSTTLDRQHSRWGTAAPAAVPVAVQSQSQGLDPRTVTQAASQWVALLAQAPDLTLDDWKAMLTHTHPLAIVTTAAFEHRSRLDLYSQQVVVLWDAWLRLEHGMLPKRAPQWLQSSVETYRKYTELGPALLDVYKRNPEAQLSSKTRLTLGRLIITLDETDLLRELLERPPAHSTAAASKHRVSPSDRKLAPGYLARQLLMSAESVSPGATLLLAQTAERHGELMRALSFRGVMDRVADKVSRIETPEAAATVIRMFDIARANDIPISYLTVHAVMRALNTLAVEGNVRSILLEMARFYHEMQSVYGVKPRWDTYQRLLGAHLHHIEVRGAQFFFYERHNYVVEAALKSAAESSSSSSNGGSKSDAAVPELAIATNFARSLHLDPMAAQLLDLVTRTRDWRESVKLFEFLRDQGYPVTVPMLESVADAYLRQRRWDHRFAEYATMVSDVAYANALVFLVVAGGTVLDHVRVAMGAVSG